ncbi:hypothetical protein D3C80_1419510 [compost metagenome]
MIAKAEGSLRRPVQALDQTFRRIGLQPIIRIQLNKIRGCNIAESYVHNIRYPDIVAHGNQSNLGILRKRIQSLQGIIGRSVIHNKNQFRTPGLLERAPDSLSHCLFMIIDGDDDGIAGDCLLLRDRIFNKTF